MKELEIAEYGQVITKDFVAGTEILNEEVEENNDGEGVFYCFLILLAEMYCPSESAASSWSLLLIIFDNKAR